MLNLAKEQQATSMLYLSTSEIYGNPHPEFIPTPETYFGNVSSTGVRACYDESKRLAETLCMEYVRQFDTPVKIVRPFNTYGAGQRIDDKRIIPDLMLAAQNQQPIVLHSDGSPTRSFCYIRDAVIGMLLVWLSDHHGEVFNVGNDQAEISMRNLAELFCEIVNEPWAVVKYQTSDDQHYLSDNPQRRCPDISKMGEFFGWQPQVSLEDGLRRTLRSYQVG